MFFIFPNFKNIHFTKTNNFVYQKVDYQIIKELPRYLGELASSFLCQHKYDTRIHFDRYLCLFAFKSLEKNEHIVYVCYYND